MTEWSNVAVSKTVPKSISLYCDASNILIFMDIYKRPVFPFLASIAWYFVVGCQIRCQIWEQCSDHSGETLSASNQLLHTTISVWFLAIFARFLLDTG